MKNARLFLTGITLAISALAIWSFADQTGAPVPIVRLQYKESLHDGIRGSGCWKEKQNAFQSATTCWKAPFPVPTETITINRGDSVNFNIAAGGLPDTAILHVFTNQNTFYKDMHLDSVTVAQIDWPAGTYVISYYGKWPEGDVSYAFSIQLHDI